MVECKRESQGIDKQQIPEKALPEKSRDGKGKGARKQQVDRQGVEALEPHIHDAGIDIAGEKKQPHTLDRAKCVKCGVCYDVCMFNAVNTDKAEKSA